MTLPNSGLKYTQIMIQSTTKHRNTGERQNGIRDVIPKENSVHKKENL